MKKITFLRVNVRFWQIYCNPLSKRANLIKQYPQDTVLRIQLNHHYTMPCVAGQPLNLRLAIICLLVNKLPRYAGHGG